MAGANYVHHVASEMDALKFGRCEFNVYSSIISHIQALAIKESPITAFFPAALNKRLRANLGCYI